MSDFYKTSDKLKDIFNKGKSEKYLEFENAAWSGNLDKVIELNFPIAKEKDYELLNELIRRGHIDVIEHILKNGWTRCEEGDGYYYYIAKFANLEIISLLEKYLDFNFEELGKVNYPKKEFIAESAKSNNIEMINWVMDCYDFNEDELKYALHYSVIYGCPETFIKISQKYKIKIKDDSSYKDYIKKCLVKSESRKLKTEWNKDGINANRYEETIMLIKKELIVLIN